MAQEAWPYEPKKAFLNYISHAFFGFTREHGWSSQDLEVVRTLLGSWRVRIEELFGSNSSPLEHVVGLQSYQEEDGDALDNDLPISYTELLHSGQSKRVQAMHDPLPSEEVLKSNKEISFVPKIQRKRKMTEKMKLFCELDIVCKKDVSSKEKTRSKHVKSVGNDAIPENLLDVNSYCQEDMETILLVYMKKKIVHDMYFSLRKTFLRLKKEEKSFYIFCKEFKKLNSQVMVSLITSWLIDMKKNVVHGSTSLSAKNIEIIV
ncbi:hypothetical protein L7F22_033652 [Adiantum nelumboides]|nr:hypothetical protein [Adiantum nelumboides]